MRQNLTFSISEIKFIGQVFNIKGVKVDSSKIDAIVKMPIPKNV